MALAWKTIQDTIRTWLLNSASSQSGVPLGEVLFAREVPKGPQPTDPYGMLSFRGPRRAGEGLDELQWNPTPTWGASTAYSPGTRLINGANLYQCTTGGISAIASPAWAGTTGYLTNAQVVNGGNVYQCSQSGTSAASGGPTGTGLGIVDGTCKWNYVSASGGPTGTGSGILDGACVWQYVSSGSGNEVTPQIARTLEFTVTAEVFVPKDTGQGTAGEYLENAMLALFLPSQIVLFNGINIAVVDVGEVLNVSDLVETDWQGRSLVEVTFRAVDTASDVPTGYIQSASIAGVYTP